MKTNKSKAVDEVLEKYLIEFSDMKDYTLARLIHNENKHLFKTLEVARSLVRARRGHNGKSNTKDKRFYKPLNYDTTNSYISIINRAPKLEKFKLPTSIKSVLFLSDIHLPYQDDIALNTAIKYGVENKVDCIWLNGDILDMYGASDHEKLPDHAMLNEEFEIANDFFTQLRKLFPKATIYFKEGNHERRWTRLLARKAPEILGIREFELNIILKLEEFKIHWIPNEAIVNFGNLHVIHGNEFKGGGGINPAKALFNNAKANIIAGDKHRTGENHENSIDDVGYQTYSVGCLCDLNPKYYPFAHTRWNHGFAHIKIKNGIAEVKNYRIKGKKIL